MDNLILESYESTHGRYIQHILPYLDYFNKRKYRNSVYCAYVLSELMFVAGVYSTKRWVVSHDKHGGGWIPYSIEKMEGRLFIGHEIQMSAIKVLIKENFIKKQSFGIPRTRHFRVHVRKIQEVLNDFFPDSLQRANYEINT